MSFKYCKVVKGEIELIFWLSPGTGKFHEMLNQVRGILTDFEKSVTVTIISFQMVPFKGSMIEKGENFTT